MTADGSAGGPRRLTRNACAKINLTLHVTGQRPDGYHLLDSLVCFADVADEITVTAAPDLSLSVDGPLGAGVPDDNRNLVMQAAQLFAHPQGARIRLTKHLPHAAGIGGGSADAAAALLALAELWDAPLPDDIVGLGADVPVCLSPAALRMRGVGELLDPVPPFPEAHAVLVNPAVAVETPPVFKALDQKQNPPMPHDIPAFEDVAALAAWCGQQRNDLETPARQIAPVIGAALDALRGTLLARMSGSGATCFGLCANKAQADHLAAQIAADQPLWWVKSVRLS